MANSKDNTSAKASKTTVKTVETAKALTDLNKASLEELDKLLIDKRTEQLQTKRSHKAGELVNPRVLAESRKQIARIMTAISAKKAAITKESK